MNRLDEIQALLELAANTGLEEVEIETKDIKIRIKQHGAPTSIQAPVQPIPTPIKTAEAVSLSQEEDQYLIVKAPMIGSFYHAPSPEDKPFVQVGDTVSKGQTIGLIEAMKLFNEIESEYSGKVVKVLVENSEPVEYDQPLMLIDPL